MRNAIVTCVTGNWVPWAAVTLLSCVENGKAADADLLICAHGISAQDRAALDEFNSVHGMAIRLIEVDASQLVTAPLGQWGIGTIIRLMLDTVIAQTYGRVLYLDSDVLVLAPLAGLLGVALDGCPAAAVTDMGCLDFLRPAAAERKRRIGFTEQGSYFNAGVMLFDWKATLAGGTLREARDLLNRRTDLASPDQDALNLVLKDNWKRLDYRWNVLDIGRLYLRLAPFIVHFTGRKPWSDRRASRDLAYRNYYARCLQGTRWAGRVAGRRSLAVLGPEAKSLWKSVTGFRRRRKLRQYIATL